MKINNSKTILKSLTVLALFALSIQALATWSSPNGTPPDNNTKPPINTSLTGQDKDGALIVGGLRSDTSVIGVENGLFGALDLPNASSVLELRSVTKGFLPPRMNLTQRNAIASPAAGLLIYQTDNAPGFYYFDGTNWMAIGSGGNGGGGGGGGGIGGSGTPNTIAKWTSASVLGDSSLTDDGFIATAGVPVYLSHAFFVGTQVIVITASNANNFPLGGATYFQINRLPGENADTVHGFASSNEDGRVAYLTNQSSSITFTLKNNSSSTALQNRLATISGADITLAPRETIMMVYDAGYPGGSRWRELFKSQ